MSLPLKEIDPLIIDVAKKLSGQGQVGQLVQDESRRSYVGPQSNYSEYFILNGYRIAIVPPEDPKDIEGLNAYARSLLPCFRGLKITKPDGYHPALLREGDSRRDFDLWLPTVSGYHEVATRVTTTTLEYEDPTNVEVDLEEIILDGPNVVRYPIVNKLRVVVTPNIEEFPSFGFTTREQDKHFLELGFIRNNRWYDQWLGIKKVHPEDLSKEEFSKLPSILQYLLGAGG